MSPTIDASLNYVRRSADRRVDFNCEPPPGMPRSTVAIEARTVTIADARDSSKPGLDVAGFEYARVGSSLTTWREFQDPARVADDYYDEVRSALRGVSGAESVVVFDHTLRDSAVGRGSAALREPVGRVHNDQTFRSAPVRLARALSQSELSHRPRRRWAIVNFWRPVGTVERSPLAMCDSRSVALADLLPTELVYADWSGETFSVAFNPDHRWLWCSRQPPELVTLLKVFDSQETGVARIAPHTAFELPSTPFDAPPRRSIEVRAFVFR